MLLYISRYLYTNVKYSNIQAVFALLESNSMGPQQPSIWPLKETVLGARIIRTKCVISISKQTYTENRLVLEATTVI